MLLYRICLSKWASSLKASGKAARWNSKGKFVIYTAENRSLACLENLVHRSGFGKNELYKIVVIDVPFKINIREIRAEELPENWADYPYNQVCREIGDRWIQNLDSSLLKVPSSIIPQENNYLINPLHKDFTSMKVKSVEDFNFDRRLNPA